MILNRLTQQFRHTSPEETGNLRLPLPLDIPVRHLLARRCASPANIASPCNRVELKVIEGELACERTRHKLINALDLVNALPEPVDNPAKADVRAVVEDLEDREGWRGWRVEEGGDVCGFAGEGDGVELQGMLD